MTPQRWQKLQDIYEAALQQSAEARPGFLKQACAGESELVPEIERLLLAHEAGSFLKRREIELAAHGSDNQVTLLKPGQRLGSYEILSLIGSGGMGLVWRARDPALNREVAIKTLPSLDSHDPERLRRFKQEAQAAGQLNHPNVLAVYAVGEEQGSPYLVTELLDGATLRERLTHDPLSHVKALDYANQIAEGLAAAHQKGIVHRDVKPENIFITKDGLVKILDFGLAQLTEPRSSVLHEHNGPTQLTAAGMIIGTPAYMSPEQVRAERADSRSDIFALGAVLYEMLAGTPAFLCENPVETLNAVLKQDPPSVEHLSPTLERIVRHCLEKGAPERFQSARDLAFQLRLVQGFTASGGAELKTVSTPATPRSIWLWIVASVLLIAGSVATILAWRARHPAPRPLVQVSADLGDDATLALDAARGTTIAISPDGLRIAFLSKDADGQTRLSLRLLESSKATPLPGTEDAETRSSRQMVSGLRFSQIASSRRSPCEAELLSRSATLPTGVAGVGARMTTLSLQPTARGLFHACRRPAERRNR